MTETTRTTQPTIPVVRLPLAAALVAASLVAAIALATSFQAREVGTPRDPAPAVVTDGAGYAGNLYSEYLIEVSRAWGPVPMTLAQQRLMNDLNSEYLRGIGSTFVTPMTLDQARIRGELNSEYLRESALGW